MPDKPRDRKPWQRRTWYWMGLAMAFFFGSDLIQHKFGYMLMDAIFLVISLIYSAEEEVGDAKP